MYFINYKVISFIFGSQVSFMLGTIPYFLKSNNIFMYQVFILFNIFTLK